MLAHGGGKPEVCATNLLKITRYEIPYERLKGLPAELIDMPAPMASLHFTEAATRMLEVYEPRLPENTIVRMADYSGSEVKVIIDTKNAMRRE